MKKIIVLLLFSIVVNNIFSQYVIPDFIDFKQVIPSYGTIPLGNGRLGTDYCNTTNGALSNSLYCAGCVVTSQSMLMNLNGLDVNPLVTNAWLKNTLKSELLSKEDLCNYPGSTIKYLNSTSTFNPATLKNSIDNNNPIIFRVNQNTHTVVIYGYRNKGTEKSDFIVSDPRSYQLKTIDDYSITRFDYYNDVYKFKSINQSLDIFGGSITSPKSLDLYFNQKEINTTFNISNIQNIKISNGTITRTISTARLSGSSLSNIKNSDGVIMYWRHFNLNLIAADLTGLSNSYDKLSISYEYNDNGTIKQFKNSSLYFSDFNNTSTTFTDITNMSNYWAETYIRGGANLGLFRGSNLTTFNPAQSLTRGQAAIVLIKAAIKLGLCNIDKSTVNGKFSDESCQPGTELFAYVQTMRNYGFAAANTNFYPDRTITLAEFCVFIQRIFEIADSDYAPTDYINALRRRIVAQNSNVEYNKAMNSILQLVFINEPKTNFVIGENLWDFADISEINNPVSGDIIVDGSRTLNRATMARILTNLTRWKAIQKGIVLKAKSVSNSLSNIVSIGEKYDNSAISSGSAPQQYQVSFTCPSGGAINIPYPSDYDASGNPLHFYWSMLKNGATLTSNSTNHKSVKFTAPIVNNPTDWHLYSYVGNNKGRAIEIYMTIKVGGNSTSTNVPSVQASSLNSYAITNNSAQVSWTRGNGQYCIVTCNPTSSVCDVPENGISYTANSNYNSAQVILSNSLTKVLYVGTGTSCNITGLTPNTKYQICVYEFNGNGNSTIFNLNNQTVSSFTTLPITVNVPEASFTWNSDARMQVGSTYTFTNASKDADKFEWSVSPLETISNKTSARSTAITFQTNGKHTVTLNATNSISGKSDFDSQDIYIYSGDELKPELETMTLSLINTVVAGDSLTILCEVRQNSISCESGYETSVVYALSSDKVMDDNDEFLGSSKIVIWPGESVSTKYKCKIPNTFSGTYNLIAKVDYGYDEHPNGFIMESNENNNSISKEITIIKAYPDLITKSLTASKTTLKSGEVFKLTGIYKNIGAGNTNAQSILATTFLSKDNNLSKDDIDLAMPIYISSGDIYFANSKDVTASSNDIYIPYNTPNGNFYIISAIDFNFYGIGLGYDFNIESNENNNWFSMPITVSNPTQPTINTSNIKINSVQDSTITLSWKRGNGSKCIVLACEGGTVPEITKDNIEYVANNDYKVATFITNIKSNISKTTKAVYTGTDTICTIRNLIPNTTYTFQILEYNGTLTSTDYLQVSPIRGISGHTSTKTIDPFILIDGSAGNYAHYNLTKSIYFFDNKTGIFFKDHIGFAKTIDGGKTWKYIDSEILNNYKNDYLTNSFWQKDGKGFLCFGNGVILKTIDFGESWSLISIDRVINDIYFIDENIGYIACGRLLNISQKGGAIYKTVDGGNTWKLSELLPDEANAIYFLNNSIGWVFYGYKNMTKTINGGTNWSNSMIGSTNYFNWITDAFFIDENNGFAITYFGRMLKTSNGGASWTYEDIFNVEQTNINCYSKIHFYNKYVGYINLQNKKLAKTINGGLTWSIIEIQSANNAENVGEVFALDENTVFVGGYSGLFKSTTGGNYNKISLSSEQNAVCAGSVLEIDYNITGQYNNNNSFTIQLSDKSGSFITPIIISGFQTIGIGKIQCTIPATIESGNYQLRVLSNSPEIISDTLKNIIVTGKLATTLRLNISNNTICAGESVLCTITATNAGVNPIYEWKVNGNSVGTSSPSYSSSTFKNGDIVWVEVTPSSTCSNNNKLISDINTINVINVEEPYILSIDSILAASTDMNLQWYLNGKLIEGATSQFLIANQNGFYQVKTTVNGCTVNSNIYKYTSITNLSETPYSTIMVYPIPAKDHLILKSTELIFQVSIYDLSGSLLLQTLPNSKEYSLNIQKLNVGAYLLKCLFTNNKETNIKIIKTGK